MQKKKKKSCSDLLHPAEIYMLANDLTVIVLKSSFTIFFHLKVFTGILLHVI